MSSYDKLKMELPNNGGTFVGVGDLTVRIQQKPKWLFNGLQETFAATDQLNGSTGALTEQVYQGAGSKVRSFEVDFINWQGNSEQWGGANADDDIITKMQTLDHALATTRITSDSTAVLEFGEYSSGGTFSPIDVVPGETDLPVNFEENTSAFNPRLTWLDAVDLTQVIHD